MSARKNTKKVAAPAAEEVKEVAASAAASVVAAAATAPATNGAAAAAPAKKAAKPRKKANPAGGESADEGDDPNRKKLIAQKVGITISIPRIRRSLDGHGINKEVTDALAELKKVRKYETDLEAYEKGAKGEKDPKKPEGPVHVLSAAANAVVVRAYAEEEAKIIKHNSREPKKPKDGTPAAPVDQYPLPVLAGASTTDKITIVGHLKYRFSNESAATAAIACEYVVGQFIVNTLKNFVEAPAEGGKAVRIVGIEHALHENYKSLEVSPLIRDLSCVTDTCSSLQNAELQQAKADMDRARERLRAATGDAAVDVVEDDVKEQEKEIGYGTYTKEIFKSAYADITARRTTAGLSSPQLKISSDMRRLTSDIVSQLCEALSRVLARSVQKADARTVKDEDIIHIIGIVLGWAGVNDGTIITHCSEKIALFKRLDEQQKKEDKIAKEEKKAKEAKEAKEAAAPKAQ
jgi:histone H3/H4